MFKINDKVKVITGIQHRVSTEGVVVYAGSEVSRVSVTKDSMLQEYYGVLWFHNENLELI